MTASIRASRKALARLVVLAWFSSAGMHAFAMSPVELGDLARRTSFEVVLPKIEPDFVRYEKPLPLELLTYTERTDRYWSIGTAFAIAPDTYVSAAHVLLSGIGSPMGKPHLRDSSGNTYVVDQVLKFSLHEDYIVFRASGMPKHEMLVPNRAAATGTAIYAVGNALGDGVVVRDGLLTSMTPEDEDGRWKWLRFSAAASPGNSGGPLLDADGHVAGVIIAKSPGENLNYALPIARVLDGNSTAATIDKRGSVGVPILRQQQTVQFKDSFALPASWDSFSRSLIQATNRQYESSQKRVLDQQDDLLPPRGSSARLLATLNRDSDMALIKQQDDDTWGLSDPDGLEETELPDSATLSTGSLGASGTFRLKRAAIDTSPALYRDSRAFMDTLLKGLKIPRVVGPQAIRITSLGAPQSEDKHTDRFGRIWQLRTWSLGYSDVLVVTLALPTPDGYAGLLHIANAFSYSDALAELYLTADYMHVRYQGSLAQWRSFLADHELSPPMLRNLQIDKGKDYSLRLRNLAVKVPASLLALDEESTLVMIPGYRADGRQLRADFAGMTLSVRPEDASWIGLFAQARPADAAGSKLQERWKKMSGKQSDFDGQPQYSSDYKDFWTTSALGGADEDLLYEIVLSWREKTALIPRQVGERRDRLLSGLQFIEKEQ